MPQSCRLYYITDRTAFASDEPTRRSRLLDKISEATRAGIDYIQLREKDLPVRDLQSLAREATNIIANLRTENPGLKTALLINSRTDVALAVQADGVHLRSDDVSAQEVRAVWKKCGVNTRACEAPVIAVSCHSVAEVFKAAEDAATFTVFAPVFEKKNAQPVGLNLLHQACQAKIPVLALGGVNLDNAHQCLEAGAAGIAGIRLFQENNIVEVTQRLRNL